MSDLPRQFRRPRGFTFIELLVVFGVLMILLAIFIPYLTRLRELSRRTACAQNLGRLGEALRQYAHDNQYNFPRVRYDEAHNPNGYAAYTGPFEPSPFAPNSQVSSNDVTASLWLLMRGGYLANLGFFICPSSSDMRDPLAIARGAAADPRRRSNFAGSRNLSYSYASPFSNAWDYQLNSDHMPAEFALMADKNPGFATVNLEVTGPARDAQPFELEKANSFNHQRAGQNVLFAAGYVAFTATPYCGLGNDNIFTALAPSRLNGEHPPLDRPGYLGHSVGPAYKYDSYLVPTASDGLSPAP